MGNQNVQKSAKARAANEAKKKAGTKNSLKDNEKYQGDRTAFKCVACYTDFPVTSKEAERIQHVENKHPKKKYEECFKN
eukprot:CFRG0822T1